MKRKLNIKLISILMLTTLLLLGCTNNAALGTDSLLTEDFNDINPESISSYNMEVILDSDNKLYTGKQITTYVNNSDNILSEIYFHIYPNAYKTLENAPILFDRFNKDLISYKEGHLEVLRVVINDQDVEYSVIGEDETILKVELGESLNPSQSIDIHMEYSGKLPSSGDRFGYGQRTMNFGNWYPIACVYDEDRWNLEPYYKIGDPFYSDVSNYNVRIITDSDIIVASSGNILSERVEENKRVYDIEANLMRDFAWVASKDFKIKEGIVDGTTIKLYYLDAKNTMIKHSLNVGINALKIYNKIFGKYPYSHCSIVMTEFPSGMEYPGIVFINNDYVIFNQKDMLETVIVHETAHQWWYGIVGSNQIEEAWLDEALTTYSEYIYYKEAYGISKGEDYLTRNILDGYEYGKRYLGEDTRVNKHLRDFTGWDDYGILVYTKGAMLFNEINKDYGEEVFYEILAEYFNKYKFKNATTEDLINICEDVTNDDLTNLVEKWIY
ncbi:M1 family metallopeptidase [Tissierella sp. Yu-01]|uniref:M1 family metallopeptidase n=1 Tax=Tissierella sp. Yu-01 TaxID=3035694 RepID=UPI00240CF8A4|nr:M1 family metallopeptidase [Tissierella sp. Yu-01]WFA08393.1 M1 family metallopeptidase [Tissierella sp. Yu-01]